MVVRDDDIRRAQGSRMENQLRRQAGLQRNEETLDGEKEGDGGGQSGLTRRLFLPLRVPQCSLPRPNPSQKLTFRYL
jgi:hypothetical protein